MVPSLRVRGPWLHHHHGINNWRENRMLTMQCPLHKIAHWIWKYLLVELCKEGVWVVSIQDIGSSCFCPFFCPFTPSGPIISTFNMSCNAQEILPACASQNQARHIYRGYSQCNNGVALQTSWRQWRWRQWRRAPGLVMGSRRGSHGLRLLGINPSLTRPQVAGLPGPSTHCNQSNCDLYIASTYRETKPDARRCVDWSAIWGEI